MSQAFVQSWKLVHLTSLRPSTHSSIGVVAIDIQDTDGAVVVGVSPGGGAEAAGIKVGDTIVTTLRDGTASSTVIDASSADVPRKSS